MSKKVSKRRKAKPTPTCTARDLRTKKSKRRKCTVPVQAKSKSTKPASPSGPLAAPLPGSASQDAFQPAVSSSPPDAMAAAVVAPSTDGTPSDGTPAVSQAAPPPAILDGVPTYQGYFGVQQAHRLLYRAGFGPKPGQAEELAAIGLVAAVDRLMEPGPATLVGPKPEGSFLVGGEFAPADKFAHMHLAFLDRAVRSTDSLGERMTLVLHDWFGVSELSVETPRVWDHLNLLRATWRGSFRQTLLSITSDPAMLEFLNGTTNWKQSPNENYARELMELYALGPDRGAYSETDVRELARALTGFRCDWTPTELSHNHRYDPSRHDDGVKVLFAGKPYERRGNLSWQDAINAVVDHPGHASFVVLKLWSYFMATAPPAATQAALEALYRRTGEQIAPLVRAILLHPDLHLGPTMAKGPVVFTAGLMRARQVALKSDAWSWLNNLAGQFIGRPPNVSGWNDRGWLNTASHIARWNIVREVIRSSGPAASSSYTGRTETADEAIAAALAFWANAPVTPDVLASMRRIAAQQWSAGQAGDTYWRAETFLANRQNALRHLVAAAPDSQVS